MKFSKGKKFQMGKKCVMTGWNRPQIQVALVCLFSKVQKIAVVSILLTTSKNT